MKPHDILVICKLLIIQKHELKWSLRSLAQEVFLSLGETHYSVKRLEEAGIFDKLTRTIIPQNALEMIIHGVKYVFPAKSGSPTRGILTAYSAPVMMEHISGNEKFVWPYAKGTDKGIAINPLSKDLPRAIENCKELYDMIALIDCIRIGKVREKALAEKMLNDLIMIKYE